MRVFAARIPYGALRAGVFVEEEVGPHGCVWRVEGVPDRRLRRLGLNSDVKQLLKAGPAWLTKFCRER
jgi:hypothetical protein